MGGLVVCDLSNGCNIQRQITHRFLQVQTEPPYPTKTVVPEHHLCFRQITHKSCNQMLRIVTMRTHKIVFLRVSVIALDLRWWNHEFGKCLFVDFTTFNHIGGKSDITWDISDSCDHAMPHSLHHWHHQFEEFCDTWIFGTNLFPLFDHFGNSLFGAIEPRDIWFATFYGDRLLLSFHGSIVSDEFVYCNVNSDHPPDNPNKSMWHIIRKWVLVNIDFAREQE